MNDVQLECVQLWGYCRIVIRMRLWIFCVWPVCEFEKCVDLDFSKLQLVRFGDFYKVRMFMNIVKTTL